MYTHVRWTALLQSSNRLNICITSSGALNFRTFIRETLQWVAKRFQICQVNSSTFDLNIFDVRVQT